MNQTNFSNINEYIACFPDEIQEKLELLRVTIKKAAPDAEEVISYQMPAFKFHGVLVYFAAAKNHIGFYPTASPIIAFKKELANYEGSKGTVRFPFDKPLPLDLISRIVEFKVAENLAKANAKKKK